MQCLVRVVFGCLAAVACGILYAAYLSACHDRKFWFSAKQVGNYLHRSSTLTPHITLLNMTLCLHQELEREISFQGGSGLYYYFYKHMLSAPSFERGPSILTQSFFFFLKEMTLYQFSHGELLLFSGFYELMMDNRTISGQTINAVERLSLYPEVITSFIYRYTNSQVGGSFSLGHISTDTLNYFLVSF